MAKIFGQQTTGSAATGLIGAAGGLLTGGVLGAAGGLLGGIFGSGDQTTSYRYSELSPGQKALIKQVENELPALLEGLDPESQRALVEQVQT